MSEFRRDLVLEDDVVFGALASLSSDTDDTSYSANTSDEFLSAAESIHNFSIDESSLCWMKAAEAEWRTISLSPYMEISRSVAAETYEEHSSKKEQ